MSSPRSLSSPLAASCAGRPMSDSVLALVAARFAVLADPLRLRLVHLLFDGEADVQTLVDRSGGTQANVSRHLHTLAGAGVLRRRKAGLHVYYAIDDPVVHCLCALTCASLEKQLSQQARVFVLGEGAHR